MKIKRLTDTAQLPTRASDGAAGLDLYADVPFGAITIYPGETNKIHTGIAVELRPYQVGLVYPRSGRATKDGLRLATVGVIDSDYRGEVIVALHNDSRVVKYIEHGERIAQLVVMQYEHEEVQEVKELNGTQRGSGGFGSTGVK